ncbi:hypothetical protein ABIF68_006806 [Bradyrhizobium japonicum]
MAFDFPNAPTIGQVYQGYTWDGEKWTASAGGGGGGGSSSRPPLLADTTYFVRTDGNDANSGLANSAGGAFLTIGKALTVAGGLDCGVYQLTISAQAGTFNESLTLPRMLAAKTPILRGIGSTTIVAAPTGMQTIVATGCTPWIISNMKLTASGAFGHCVTLSSGASIIMGAGMDYGAATGYHLYVQGGCGLTIIGDYSITGGASAHIVSNGWVYSAGRAVTVGGGVAFGDAYCIFNLSGATYFASGLTFGGTATGVRYMVMNGASIFTSGGGANYFPGSIAGSGSTPGVLPYGSYS